MHHFRLWQWAVHVHKRKYIICSQLSRCHMKWMSCSKYISNWLFATTYLPWQQVHGSSNNINMFFQGASDLITKMYFYFLSICKPESSKMPNKIDEMLLYARIYKEDAMQSQHDKGIAHKSPITVHLFVQKSRESEKRSVKCKL